MRPKLAISGAAGRMGRRIIALAIEANEFDIVAAVEKKGHADTGKDAGIAAGMAAVGIKVGSEYPAAADVLVDFSQPQAADEAVRYCCANGTALVMGTTGLTSAQQDKIKQASENIAVIYATNMSLGMNLLFALVGRVALKLGNDYDVEIVEQHHRFKKDAPSGTALTLAEKICETTGRDFPGCLVCGRKGTDTQRAEGNIGIHSVRAGDITGVHSVIFSTTGETVTLNHTAHSRDCFARGALRAAKWVLDKPAGLYSMADVLGLQ